MTYNVLSGTLSLYTTTTCSHVSLHAAKLFTVEVKDWVVEMQTSQKVREIC